jgi:hypothetical protein
MTKPNTTPRRSQRLAFDAGAGRPITPTVFSVAAALFRAFRNSVQVL